MAVLALSEAILLMSIWTGNLMNNTNTLKESIKFFILPSPIYLHKKDFLIKKAFYHVLKFMETLKHFRFMFQQIYPSKFTKIINEANIKIILANRGGSGSPYISSRGLDETLVDLG